MTPARTSDHLPMRSSFNSRTVTFRVTDGSATLARPLHPHKSRRREAVETAWHVAVVAVAGAVYHEIARRRRRDAR